MTCASRPFYAAGVRLDLGAADVGIFLAEKLRTLLDDRHATTEATVRLAEFTLRADDLVASRGPIGSFSIQPRVVPIELACARLSFAPPPKVGAEPTIRRGDRRAR